MKTLRTHIRGFSLMTFLTLMICMVFGSVGTLLMPTPAHAQGLAGCLPSVEKTADAAIMAKAGYFCGIMVITDGTNSVTIDIYDNATAASGTEIIPLWTVTTSASNRSAALEFTNGIFVNSGIYVDITTSGAVTYVVYSRGRN